MGYAKVGQDTRGIHTRLYARAFIVVDEEGNRIVYVNVELCAPTQLIRIKVNKSPLLLFLHLFLGYSRTG